nr:MAG TPA: hypothetical protein [Caudoviricetes sp.]
MLEFIIHQTIVFFNYFHISSRKKIIDFSSS